MSDYADLFQKLCHVSECAIAGGYVRDTVLGKEVKDVDIFIHSSQSWMYWKGVLDELGEGFKHRMTPAYGFIESISCMFESKEYDLPVQIMIMKTPIKETVEQGFDFDICKCYTIGKDMETILTKEFMQSVEDQKLYLKYSEVRHNAFVSLQRGERLQHKYPWPIEVQYVR